jgi:sugar fermentation stimulation protein A
MAAGVIAKGLMNYNHGPLQEGQFLKRYKRFFADVKLGNETVVAHVANTGSLKGVCDKPHACRVEHNNDPNRKLKYTLMQVGIDTTWVGVNTHLANTLVHEAWKNQQIPHWRKYTNIQPEYKLSKETRLDFLLSNTAHKHYVEVKSVTLAEGSCALFPDAVTERGQKHLRELISLLGPNSSAEIFYVIQRTDCTEFAPAATIDPVYAILLKEAQEAGVKVSAFPVTLERDRISLDTSKDIKIVCR